MPYDSTVEAKAHIAIVQKQMARSYEVIVERRLIHDASKLEDPEKSLYDEWQPKLTPSDPDYDVAKVIIQEAVELHRSINSHHPESHEDISEMGLFDQIEMVCDWYAYWSAKQDGDFLSFLETKMDKYGCSPGQRVSIGVTANEMGMIPVVVPRGM